MEDIVVDTNLKSLLDCTTPCGSLPKSERRKLNRLWYPWEREKLDYFVLADLWKSFDESRAYEVGVPVTTDDGQNVVQYFVPYISAIQIFTSSPANCLREETDLASEARDSSSNSIIDESESESCQGGMDAHQKKVHLIEMAYGFQTRDWGIFTFSTLRDHLLIKATSC